MHGAFDTQTNEFISENLFVFAVIDKCFELSLDFIINILYQKHVLES